MKRTLITQEIIEAVEAKISGTLKVWQKDGKYRIYVQYKYEQAGYITDDENDYYRTARNIGDHKKSGLSWVATRPGWCDSLNAICGIIADEVEKITK